MRNYRTHKERRIFAHQLAIMILVPEVRLKKWSEMHVKQIGPWSQVEQLSKIEQGWHSLLAEVKKKIPEDKFK